MYFFLYTGNILSLSKTYSLRNIKQCKIIRDDYQCFPTIKCWNNDGPFEKKENI